MPNDKDNSQYADTGWSDDDGATGGQTNKWGKAAKTGLGATAGAIKGAQSQGQRYQGAQSGSPNPMPNSTGAEAGGMLGALGNAYNRYQGAQQINNSAQGGMPPMQPAGGQVPFGASPVNSMLPPSAPSPIMAQGGCVQPMAGGGMVNGLQGNGENNIPAQPVNAPEPYGGPLGPMETLPHIPAVPMAGGGMVGGPTDQLTGAPTGAFGGMTSQGAQYNGPGAMSTALPPQQPMLQQSQGGGFQMGSGQGGPQQPQGGWKPQGMGGGQAGPGGQFGQGGGQNRWGGGQQQSSMQPPQQQPMQSGSQTRMQQPMRYQPGPPQYQAQQMGQPQGGPMAPPPGQAAMAKGGVIDGGIPGMEPPKAEAAMRRYSPIGPRNPAAMFSPAPTDEAHRLPNRMSLTPKINVKMPHPKKFGTGPK